MRLPIQEVLFAPFQIMRPTSPEERPVLAKVNRILRKAGQGEIYVLVAHTSRRGWAWYCGRGWLQLRRFSFIQKRMRLHYVRGSNYSYDVLQVFPGEEKEFVEWKMEYSARTTRATGRAKLLKYRPGYLLLRAETNRLDKNPMWSGSLIIPDTMEARVDWLRPQFPTNTPGRETALGQNIS